MQVKVEVLEGLQRKVVVEVPAEQVNEKIQQRLKKVQKTAKMDGFRPGKIPMKIVEQKYQGAVRQEVLGDLIESTYGDAIKQEKLTPAGQPAITPVSGFAANENFVYEATLEVVPEFEVKGLDSLAVKKPDTKVLAKDVKTMVDNLRKQAATWEISEEAAADGDRAVIDFAGKIDGEAFEGGSAEDFSMQVGAKQMLPEFEAAVVDAKVGDTVTATVNFPEDYHGKEVAGKTAEFDITIKRIEKPKLPRVDESFIKRFGVEEGTREAFENLIRENMERELTGGVRKYVNQQVMQHLVDANNAVLVPESMVKNEVERMVQESGVEKQIQDTEELEKIKLNNFDQPARRRVLLGLIMGKLFESQKIIPDPKRLEERVETIAATYEDPQEVREFYNSNANAREQLFAQVMEDQLIESLLENATVESVKKSFDEVMNATPGA